MTLILCQILAAGKMTPILAAVNVINTLLILAAGAPQTCQNLALRLHLQQPGRIDISVAIRS